MQKLGHDLPKTNEALYNRRVENEFTTKHNVLEQLAADAASSHNQDLGGLDRLLQGRLKDSLHLSHCHSDQAVALSEET